jgi:archaetidylinositol phosphate synthase
MADIRSHKRIINTLTGPAERAALPWLAARMPAWVTPDVLTALGVLGGVIIFFAYWATNLHPAFLWLASLGFVINWFGDSLDGTLARYRHIERPTYGFYIDHVVDAYMEVLVFLGLGLSPFVRFNLASLALIGYMLLSVLVYIRTAVKGEFTISYGKLGPTEARLIAIGANTLVFFIGNPVLEFSGVALTVYDWMLAGIVILLFVVSLATTYAQARSLANLERPGKLLSRAHKRPKNNAGKARSALGGRAPNENSANG